jgi:hypothetical protein
MQDATVEQQNQSVLGGTREPGGLLDVLKPVGSDVDLHTPSDSPSEEDYDEDVHAQPTSVLLRRRPAKVGSYDSSAVDSPELIAVDTSSGLTTSSSFEHLQPLTQLDSGDKLSKKTYVVASDDAELREILKRGLERVCCCFEYRNRVHTDSMNRKWKRNRSILDVERS